MGFLDKARSRLAAANRVDDAQNSENEQEDLGPFAAFDTNFTDSEPVEVQDKEQYIPAVRKNKIQDILAAEQIPTDLIIPKDVLVEDDFKNIHFELQTPVGYEQGQVDTALRQASLSIRFYHKTLQDRMADIARLATVIDRMQVNLHNLRYDQEIASASINIIPTSDYDDLEQKYNELLIKMRNLESKKGDKSRFSDEFVNGLQDNLGIAQREIEDLKNENRELRARNNYLEEEYNVYDDKKESTSVTTNPDDFKLPDLSFDDSAEDENDIPVTSLPDLNEAEQDAVDELPPIETLEESSAKNSESGYTEEEGGVFFTDDEADSLDDMIKSWNKP